MKYSLFLKDTLKDALPDKVVLVLVQESSDIAPNGPPILCNFAADTEAEASDFWWSRDKETVTSIKEITVREYFGYVAAHTKGNPFESLRAVENYFIWRELHYF